MVGGAVGVGVAGDAVGATVGVGVAAAVALAVGVALVAVGGGAAALGPHATISAARRTPKKRLVGLAMNVQ